MQKKTKNMKSRFEFQHLFAVGVVAALLGPMGGIGAEAEETVTNSVGMSLVRIQPGSFQMGKTDQRVPQELVGGYEHRIDGDADEKPAHQVTISEPFYMSTTEVTNEQFEQFDPTHRFKRGKLGFSIEDDEAVVFVSWHDAMAFCEWLSEKEGKPYRLPTEAEWEYACRAGTTTPFHTGEDLPDAFWKNVGKSWYPDPERSGGREELVSLHVGRTPANPWGLFDMHGNVEEWCLDWYGPYSSASQADPVGRVTGNFKVARGGSHSSELYFLRSANRMAAIPQERNWLIGFRVVQAPRPGSDPLPEPESPRHQQDVRQDMPTAIEEGPDPEKPYFAEPREFVKIPDGANGPIFTDHNHVPSIVECANGDLLTIWYTCDSESGRELAVVASRLRHGQDEWEEAEIFWDQPDRNEHTSALWRAADGTLYHFNGYSVAATWGSLAVLMRRSHDHGESWSKPRLIMPEHNRRHMPIESIFRTQDGRLLLSCDNVTGGSGGTAVFLSADDGQNWKDTLGTIAGIHACVGQLKDGRLVAYGRGDNIEARMPMSISSDMGRTWSYQASPFPPVGGGQRPVILRLQEGPLVFCSFANEAMEITDASGEKRSVKGLFAAVSHDEAKTWSNVRLVSHDGPDKQLNGLDGKQFTMGFDSAEPNGYLSICQGANGVIHLISSRQHYAFNLEWLETPAPARQAD